MSLLEIFCDLDDFCSTIVPAQQQLAPPDAKPRRHRKRGLCPAEVMTLLVWFHRSGYRTFKDFYTLRVGVFLNAEFPGLVSYNRFVEYIPSVLSALCAYLSARMGTPSSYAFGRQHARSRVPQSAYPRAQGLCGPCGAGQNLHGLVLRVQGASDHQRSG